MSKLYTLEVRKHREDNGANPTSYERIDEVKAPSRRQAVREFHDRHTLKPFVTLERRETINDAGATIVTHEPVLDNAMNGRYRIRQVLA